MNNDLISREALKKALTEAHINRTLTFDIATFGCVMSAIDNAPTVDIRNKGACENCEYFGRSTTEEPCRNCTLAYGSCFKEKEKVKDDRTKGEWISSYRGCKCSICNFKTVVDTYRYCPNCGAKMKGGAE